jgi:hypothetical protein
MHLDFPPQTSLSLSKTRLGGQFYFHLKQPMKHQKIQLGVLYEKKKKAATNINPVEVARTSKSSLIASLSTSSPPELSKRSELAERKEGISDIG